jgi:type IV pilus assembly protein PilE
MNLTTTRQRGFTLLELVVVLAMVGILSLISYPIYSHHVLKTRRAQAEVALLDVAAGLERYHALHNTYGGANLANIEVNAYTENQAYQLDIADTNDTDYAVQARPLGAQAADAVCGVLSLNALGVKGVSGTGKVADCW